MREKYRRKTPFRQAKEEVLIVCGGQTEKKYFEMFNQVFRPSLGSVSVITAVETKSPMHVVEYAIKARNRKNSYNAVWCVFDKDDFIDFDDAVRHAESNAICVAYSNQAFEVWFINHFRILKAPLSRTRYKHELKKFLAFNYDKSADVIDKISSMLLTEERVRTAITNSRLGYERHKIESAIIKPSAFESCTTVFKLVQSLLSWTK
ncbi:MAG: RloB family protein [Oscillospiraceae bacterium]|nr:RloB family protein [Oscillospiraceae bacterium]